MTARTRPIRPAAKRTGFATVLFEKRDGIAWVTLNRPRVFNAYNVQMRDDLHQVLSAVHDDPEVRAMVLAGAGEAFYSSPSLSPGAPRTTGLHCRWNQP